MWPQNVEGCSHNSKIDCKMLKVAVIIRNVIAKCWKLRSNFGKNHSHVTAFFLSCSHFLKITIIFINFAVTFQILKSYFESCSHVIADFEIWLQSVESCSHISNYDCNFQHFAVTFRIMTATFNILQSHFELWLQNVQICGHISKLAVRNRLLKLMARHTMRSED